MARNSLTAASVVSAALALANSDGFDAVTLTAVARHLGIQTPSLYSHVRDLAALRDGMAERTLAELADRIAVNVAGRSGRAALRGLADANRMLALDSPGGWESLQRRTGDAVAGSESARRVAELNLAVVSGYGLDERDTVDAVRLMASVVNGFIALERADAFRHRQPPAQSSWERMLDVVDTALRGWSS